MNKLIHGKHSPDFPRPFVFWCIAFVYASFVALILQKLVLPVMPSLHAAHGLLQNDAIHFHQVAVTLAEKINLEGWSAWRLFPEAGATGNVGLLAVLYALFDPDPAWFIPFNAAAHALGAFLIYLLGPLLWPGRIGRLGGLIAAILFLIFPSALMWYGQNHKDAFSIAGTLLLLYVWLEVLGQKDSFRACLQNVALLIVAVALIGFVKPHVLTVMATSLLISLVAMVGSISFGKGFALPWLKAGWMVCLIVLVGLAAIFMPKDRDVVGMSLFSDKARNWQWHESGWLPAPLDHLLQRVSLIRVSFIDYGASIGAGSQIDGAIVPDNAVSAIQYFPRALMVGLFTPFPNTWTERPNLFRVVGALETLVWYLCIPGALLLLFRHFNQRLLAGLIFCGFILLILGYTFPNVGTLYRQRFGVLFFFILCGAVGWASVIANFLKAVSRGHVSFSTNSQPTDIGAHASNAISTVVSSGAVVLVISTLGYLGFLVRDLLLVRDIGIGPHLDAYFTATMLPMFFVACLGQPVADAITKPFLQCSDSNQNQQRQYLIGWAVLSVTGLLLIFCLPLLLFPEFFIQLIVRRNALHLADAVHMLRIFSMVFVLSGVAIIANAVLNALHEARTVALAQLLVPIVAVAAILLWSRELGAMSAIYGMLLGQLLNIGWLFFALDRKGLRLLPTWGKWQAGTEKIVRNYMFLVLSALFTAILVPINYSFAGNLDQGSVSAWALGNKLTLLFTNMGTIIISAVALPHLAKLIAHERENQLKRDLYFMLMTGTWLAILAALVLFGFSEALLASLLEGGQVNAAQIGRLAWVLKLGSLQLPFLFAMSLCVKLAAASGTSLKVVVVTGMALVLNVVLNSLLVNQYGIAGIALATLLASAFTAVLLILGTHKQSGLRISEAILLIGSWMVLLGFGVAWYLKTKAGAVSILCALAFVLFAQWRLWRKHCAEQGFDFDVTSLKQEVLPP